MEWDEKRFLLGIDAGATKTHYALYDRKKRMLEVLTGGPANHESLAGGFSELETVLKEQVGALLGRCGIRAQQVDGAGFGMAGVDTRRQHAIVSDIFRRLGLSRFEMANDASLGIWATCPDGAGVCAVNGSGFSVYAMDGAGGEAQIGGLGDLTGDKGGGGYLTDKAVAGVYASLYKGGPETAMTGPMFASLGIARKEEFVEALSNGLYGSGNARALRRDISRILHQAAAQGDTIARDILISSGQEYAAAILGAVNELPLLRRSALQIVLVGSVFNKGECPLAIDTLAGEVTNAMQPVGCVFHRLTAPPVLGALQWAQKTAGLPPMNADEKQYLIGKMTGM